MAFESKNGLAYFLKQKVISTINKHTIKSERLINIL